MVKIQFTTNTTILKPGITADQAREMRLKGARQSEYKRAVSKGDSMEVDQETATAWMRLGIARAADDDPQAKRLEQPGDAVNAAKQDLTNSGQGAASPELNLQHPELAQIAHEAIVERLNGDATDQASAEATPAVPRLSE